MSSNPFLTLYNLKAKRVDWDEPKRIPAYNP
jgi:hypothetical protein